MYDMLPYKWQEVIQAEEQNGGQYRIVVKAPLHPPRLVGRRPRSQQRKKIKKKRPSQQKYFEKSRFLTSEIPHKFLRRCLARSKMIIHSQKMTNKRAAKTGKLNVACPKSLSKVHAIGVGDLCAPQHQGAKQNNKTT